MLHYLIFREKIGPGATRGRDHVLPASLHNAPGAGTNAVPPGATEWLCFRLPRVLTQRRRITQRYVS